MVWDKLETEMENLPRAQKIVAEYLLQNRSEAMFMTAKQVGENSATSEATAIRLATTLGFEGFPELKEALQREVKDQLSTLERLREHHPRFRSAGKLSDVIAYEMERASPRLGESDDRAIRELASAIRAADAIYLIGLRSARSLAVYMQYYLSWFVSNIFAPESDYFENYLVSAPENSLVIGISFPRYTRRTYDLVGMAAQRKIKTASISDSKSSPIARLTDISVVTPCIHVAHIDSLLIPFGMVNAILIEVADQLGAGALSRLDELERAWESGGVYL